MHISLWFLIVIFIAYAVGARMPGLAKSVGIA